MKKKFRAFTLIELIVVIAIFGIIMAGLMNFFRPIRSTYVDSTLYEQQRTVHNGILEYLCENTRYAEKIRAYDQGATAAGITVTSGAKAYEAFLKECIDDTLYEAADLKDLKYKVHIICINRSSGYSESGTYKMEASSWKSLTDGSYDKKNTHFGRLITNIIDLETNTSGTERHYKLANTTNWAGTDFDDKGSRNRGVSDGKTYMALSGGYYGAADYVIYLDPDKSSKDGLTFGVISQQQDNSNVVSDSHAVGNSKLSNNGGFITLETVQGNLMKNPESFTYYLSGSASSTKAFGTITDTGNINGSDKNTWIVFTLPDEGTR